MRENGSRKWKSFDDYETCYAEWVAYHNRNKATSPTSVEVNYIEQYTDVGTLWDYATSNPSVKRKDIPFVTFPANESFAIVFLSDLHIGNAATDYENLRRDAEIIRTTDNMYAFFHGDGIDNWIVGKLQSLQRGQSIPFDSEMALFQAWITTIQPKLIGVVAGNHDNWTKKMAGIDYLKHISPPFAMYDANEVIFRLLWGSNSKTIAVRHKWRGTSILNPTHGMERASKDIDADIYVGGHTHIGTLFRDFVVRQRDRIAVLTGTYKVVDSYGDELGLPPPQHSGCGAIVFDPDGSMTVMRNLTEAARYLDFKRCRENEQASTYA